MFCAQCGRERALDAKFCTGCGTRFDRQHSASSDSLAEKNVDAGSESREVVAPFTQLEQRFRFRWATRLTFASLVLGFIGAVAQDSGTTGRPWPFIAGQVLGSSIVWAMAGALIDLVATWSRQSLSRRLATIVGPVVAVAAAVSLATQASPFLSTPQSALTLLNGSAFGLFAGMLAGALLGGLVDAVKTRK